MTEKSHNCNIVWMVAITMGWIAGFATAWAILT
jgi:hypothetical protein